MLQKKHEENLERQARREKIDEQLAVLRKQYKKTQMDYDLEHKKMLTMREEVDNLALRLFYLNNAKLEVKSDITIMQRAAEKASSELTKVRLVKICITFVGRGRKVAPRRSSPSNAANS